MHKYGHTFRLEANGRINPQKAGIIPQKLDVYLINAHLMKEFKTIIGKAANMIKYAN
ncbi:hypothetical protein NIES4103_43340 [Nostoc sp. NIES-4103]|nr:hypothetical protein NIES4103_43340 [Nostoc sp. NIES-4103]